MAGKVQKPKHHARAQQPPRHPRRATETVLVKLHVPDGTWRVIKSRAALAGQTAGAYAVGILATTAAS